jgi:hypothetical protein
VIPLRIAARRGETTNIPIRVERAGIVYAQIETLILAAPLRVIAPGHGLPEGWRAAIVNAGGLSRLNARRDPPEDADLRRVRRIDAGAIDFPDVNGRGLPGNYQEGTGQLAFHPPLELAHFAAARMQVKDAVGGNVLATFATPGALAAAVPLDGALEIDAGASVLWLRLSAAQAAALAFEAGVFDIELLDHDGSVIAICPATSLFEVTPEITTVE